MSKKKSDVYGGIFVAIIAAIVWVVKTIIDVVEKAMALAVETHAQIVNFGLTTKGAIALTFVVLILISCGCYAWFKRRSELKLEQAMENIYEIEREQSARWHENEQKQREQWQEKDQKVKQKLERGQNAINQKEQEHQIERAEWFKYKQRADKSFQRLLDSAYKSKVKTIISGLSLKNHATRLEQLTKETENHNNLIGDLLFLNLKNNTDWTAIRCEFYLKLDQLKAAQDIKEEQAELKRQMREEKQRQDELERRQREAEEEEHKLAEQQRLIEEALLAAEGQYKEELERQRLDLEQQILDVHAQYERAKSMAQLTKQGHVYVISNIGSFGENVYKVGMTRRLEPLDRVKELGDASVPFEFDVHAMISCDDAPALEKALHNELEKYRVNKVNLRKEFFNVDLGQIISSVERNHGTIEYVVNPVAYQYYKSLDLNTEAA
ncbi:GIY-YIG nuclease family protein [Vibrio parahaemolyticus]|uniref:GIY-YIG nuclease family protein n=1 Tax=Vibrio parahaemolyticus TaxID=670 RepID=UPI002153712B|nr:GIY-YIG nuclease family protein [Vibrio parahaemolyticus]MDF4269449.1 GIY-YIG nuclease family protein [Vibrio parahaemolyticus]MDF4274726.1 GIY-YIG nuclease family protein [Vibrio parahaemolyticus]MDF4299377.1 GIY-YIG nuclease family protein [Vibrio parahaemolyticus]MDG3049037.1 GIY-YIG nuclease family protein [Vibrio parahaemolyticus]